MDIIKYFFRFILYLSGLLLICGAAFTQDFYNYPVPVNDPNTLGGLLSGQENAANSTRQEPNTDVFDKNTGLTDSNTRYGRIIHDQLDIKKNSDDVYYAWQRLAILGRDQYEIEDFYREVPPEIIEKAKERLRGRIMYNLERRDLTEYTTQTEDISDLKLALQIINEETRRFGMELDATLKSLIQARYELGPSTLEQLAYVVQ